MYLSDKAAEKVTGKTTRQIGVILRGLTNDIDDMLDDKTLIDYGFGDGSHLIHDKDFNKLQVCAPATYELGATRNSYYIINL